MLTAWVITTDFSSCKEGGCGTSRTDTSPGYDLSFLCALARLKVKLQGAQVFGR